MVWPFGCVCQAVRAPGVKWTLLALRREVSDSDATASMYTAPVNHSAGPGGRLDAVPRDLHDFS